MEGFKFRSGKYVGKSLEELAGTEEGTQYLQWAASAYPSPSVKATIRKFLDDNGIDSSGFPPPPTAPKHGEPVISLHQIDEKLDKILAIVQRGTDAK